MAIIASINLYYTSGSSDKEYRLQLISDLNTYSVSFQYGRRNNASNRGLKVSEVDRRTAERAFKSLLRQKVGKGYTLDGTGNPGSCTYMEAETLAFQAGERFPILEPRQVTPEESSLHTGQRDMDLPPAPQPEPEVYIVPERKIRWAGMPRTTTAPAPVSSDDLIATLLSQQPNPIMEESEASDLIDHLEYGMQNKYDGKHIMVRVLNGVGQAFNKKGQTVTPKGQIVMIPQTVMDSVLAVGSNLELDGELIGNKYFVYDLLKYGSIDLRGHGYLSRYETLKSILSFDEAVSVAPLYIGAGAKRAMFERIKEDCGEGVVFKNLYANFKAGRPASGGDFIKYKFYDTCSCIVTAGRTGRRSIGLRLKSPVTNYAHHIVSYDHTGVGNVTIPPNKDVPAIGNVVEIRYLYAYRGGSLYQPTYIGPRDDVDPEECLISQLKYKQEA